MQCSTAKTTVLVNSMEASPVIVQVEVVFKRFASIVTNNDMTGSIVKVKMHQLYMSFFVFLPWNLLPTKKVLSGNAPVLFPNTFKLAATAVKKNSSHKIFIPMKRHCPHSSLPASYVCSSCDCTTQSFSQMSYGRSHSCM